MDSDFNDKRPERSFKEKRIREIVFLYYLRPDVKKAMYEFSKNRECIPRYFEGFGKRPDNFQYEGDILEQVKKGATSFHCSEELWSDPLEISTELSPMEFDELRQGWDLLLDIDSPYLEYSKIYADLLIKMLEFHGIKNLGIKFSGSKGFHIIIPWNAFPKEIYGQKTKDMFPEWPRAICQYLTESIQEKLEDEIFNNQSLKELAEKLGKKEQDLLITECLSCNRPAKKQDLVIWTCPYCKEMGDITRLEKTKRIPKCPECRRELIEQQRKEISICEFCNLTSERDPERFAKTRAETEKLIEADLILVAPRHLFRMPYSLHEKTALSSIVINKDNVRDFQITDAMPLKVDIKPYYPEPEPEEAKELLLTALDWKEEKQQKQAIQDDYLRKRQALSTETDLVNKPQKSGEYKEIIIPNPSDDIFPPCIKFILKGIKTDGRKRALFVLINFFKSLGVSDDELEKRINEWNEKNFQALKKGYIQSQLIWFNRNPKRMPPNCDKPNYKDLQACHPDELCRQIKNPVNYAVKKHFSLRK